jgi:glyoxylase-like metal-dependent hydrolase (beta-lactamase superfamily II)
MNRRMLGGAALSLAASTLFKLNALAKSIGPTKTLPMTAHLQVGRFEVTVISDGFGDFPYDWFTGATPDQTKQAAKQVFAAGPKGIRTGFATYLINDGERLILVDAGPAGTVSPTTGFLPKALQSLGVTREDIDIVIITHPHVDHIAGLVVGDKANFPNADVLINRKDLEVFLDPNVRAKAPKILESSFAFTDKVIKHYKSLEKVDAGREIAKGVSLFDLSGHTPGQMGVRIEDGDQSLSLVADMLLHPAAHPAMPGFGIIFEMDKEAADASRARFFAEAAESRTLVAATHMPFPGVGHIVRDGSGLRWLPADWSYA